MHGPWLNTLQNVGVHGWPSSTLQGACENGVASIWRRVLGVGGAHPGNHDDQADDDAPEHAAIPRGTVQPT